MKPPVRRLVMDLVLFPDNRLRQKCEPVTEFDGRIRDTLVQMSRNMMRWKGIGLAAPQCGVMKRMFVASTPHGTRVFVNPTFEDIGEGSAAMAEGCLSMPGISVDLPRPAAVRVHAQDESGKEFELICRGILARCVQHETDHLDGVLMVDHLESLGHRFAMQALWDARIKAQR